MDKKIEENPLLTLLIICIGLMFFNLEQLQITIMEARNFLVTREMFQDGNYFLTTLNGIPRYEKPPAPAWLSLPFFILSSGNALFWMRFPTSLMAVLGVFIVYFWMKAETSNIRFSLMSALILATSFYYIAIRFEAPSDMHTHIWLLAGLFYLHLFLKSEKIKILLLIPASLFTALSILSKGPVSLYVLFIPFIISWFLSYKAPLLKRKLIPLLGFLLFSVLLGSSWYLYVRYADSRHFLEIAARETDNWTSYNVRPFYYYWSFFLQSGIWALPALAGIIFYPWVKNKVLKPELYKFSFIWTLLSLLLLSLIPEKKSRYLMPLLIPMAINTANFIYALFHKFVFKNKKINHSFLYFIYSVVSLICLAFPFIIFLIDIQNVDTWIWYVISSLLFITSGLYLLYSTLRQKFVRSFYLVVFIHVLIMTFGLHSLKYMPKNENHSSIRDFYNPENIPVYAYDPISPEVVWEVGQKLPLFNEKLLTQNEKYFVFVERSFEQEFLTVISGHKCILYDSYDRNLKRAESRGYRIRHVLDVYLIND